LRGGGLAERDGAPLPPPPPPPPAPPLALWELEEEEEEEEEELEPTPHALPLIQTMVLFPASKAVFLGIKSFPSW